MTGVNSDVDVPSTHLVFVWTSRNDCHWIEIWNKTIDLFIKTKESNNVMCRTFCLTLFIIPWRISAAISPPRRRSRNTGSRSRRVNSPRSRSPRFQDLDDRLSGHGKWDWGTNPMNRRRFHHQPLLESLGRFNIKMLSYQYRLYW